MQTYKFTHIEKKYYDVEIQAIDPRSAREMFDALIYNDQIDWANPDYLDSETYYEEIEP